MCRFWASAAVSPTENQSGLSWASAAVSEDVSHLRTAVRWANPSGSRPAGCSCGPACGAPTHLRHWAKALLTGVRLQGGQVNIFSPCGHEGLWTTPIISPRDTQGAERETVCGSCEVSPGDVHQTPPGATYPSLQLVPGCTGCWVEPDRARVQEH
jgi:hypothetical protein